MRRSPQSAAPALVGLLLLAALAAPAPTGAAGALAELEPVASGLDRPLGLTHAGDGSGRLFIVEQTGRIRIFDGEVLLTQPFLDLSEEISCCGERGLLGLAFHPDYAANGRFFVVSTTPEGDTVITRFEVSTDPDVTDPGSAREVLRIEQPFGNHNGSQLGFGPDGLLYYASGDGGSGGDPRDNAQSLDSLLGKILRLDVDGGDPYRIPEGNPFVGQAGALGEIWAYGFRNPWRFAFDRTTGDLYIADVGQARFEEINLQPAGSAGGENYGWRRREGNACFEPPSNCQQEGDVGPILSYPNGDGNCAVIGGFRYRGPAEPTLSRHYVFGDFCSGRVWGGRANGAGRWWSRKLVESGLAISSFGEDEGGRLYLVDYAGGVHRLRGRPIFASDFEEGDLSRWSRRRGSVGLATPGLGGSATALEAQLSGGEAAFLASKHPDREQSLEVCFRFDPNRARLGDGAVDILEIAGPRPHTRLRLTERKRGGYRLSLEVRRATGPFEEVGGVRLKRAGASGLCVEWLRATGREAADGEVRLRKGERTRAAAVGLDNRRWRADTVKIGLPTGAGEASGARGVLRFDDYVSQP